MKNKINWPRLWKSAKEVFLTMVGVAISFALFILPGILAILTNCIWLLIIYPIGIFIIETLEKYNGY